MSSDDKPTADDSSGNSDEVAGDAAFDADDLSIAPSPPRGAWLVALVALLASVLALAAAGWLWFDGQRAPDTAGASGDLAALAASMEDDRNALQAVANELPALQDNLARLEARIAQLSATDDTAGADIDALQRRLRDQLDALGNVPGRVASIERSLTALRGMSTGAEDAWLLAQAEYFLQAANAEVELRGNPGVAARALALADQRLLELNDPGLTDVRRTIAGERQALEAIDTTDLASTSATLAGLAEAADALPLRGELVERIRSGNDTELDSSLSGGARAMASLRQAFSGVVSVRRTDEEAVPLLAPEATFFLRANLSLKLQAARLALLQGDAGLYQQSLDDVVAWLHEYYDGDATGVRNVIGTLADLRSDAAPAELPDVSESLRRLRQYIAFSQAVEDEPSLPADGSDDAAEDAVEQDVVEAEVEEAGSEQ